MQLNYYDLYKAQFKEISQKEFGKYKWSIFEYNKPTAKYVTLVSNDKGYKKGTIYGFMSLERAENWVKSDIEFEEKKQRDKEELKQIRKQEEKKFLEEVKIGDILEGCWGYEACFYEFYEVIGKQGSFLLLKELKKEYNYEDLKYGACSEGYSKPVKEYASEKVLKRKVSGQGVKINSYLYAGLWDGKVREEANWH